MRRNFIVAKGTYEGDIAFVDYSKIDGLKITPKNNVSHPGIKVDSLVIIKPTLIEKVLKRKVKIKLEYYLKYISSFLDEEDDEGYRQALDSLSRFKDTLEYKYRKYLDDKYINVLSKKISMIEKELKKKIVYKELKRQTMYNEPLVEERRRSR